MTNQNTREPVVLKITKIGLEASLSAQQRGIKVTLDKIVYSSDRFTSVVSDERTEIENILFESSIGVGGVSEDKTTLRLFSVLNPPSEVEVNSVGIYTDDGVLFAIASAETGMLFKVYNGVSFNISFGMTFSPSILSSVDVSFDDNTAQALVMMNEHELHANPHPQYLRIVDIPEHIVIEDASTSVKGIVQLVDDLVTNDATKALTARQGKILAEMIGNGGGLGIDQGYEDVTTSRLNNGTRYYNHTGSPMEVIITFHLSDKKSWTDVRVSNSKKNKDVQITGMYANQGNGSMNAYVPLTFVVPDGENYWFNGGTKHRVVEMCSGT